MPKRLSRAEDSPKKQMDGSLFFDMKSSYIDKSNAVRSIFFWRIYGAAGMRNLLSVETDL